jgi:rhodanese-related sulfurtransferase
LRNSNHDIVYCHRQSFAECLQTLRKRASSRFNLGGGIAAWASQPAGHQEELTYKVVMYHCRHPYCQRAEALLKRKGGGDRVRVDLDPHNEVMMSTAPYRATIGEACRRF